MKNLIVHIVTWLVEAAYSCSVITPIMGGGGGGDTMHPSSSSIYDTLLIMHHLTNCLTLIMTIHEFSKCHNNLNAMHCP